MDNIIVTSCPAIVYLVEKHYPMLIPYLAPVVSPMIAHGRWIKDRMGQHTKVVLLDLVWRKDGGGSRCQNPWMCGCGH